MTLLRSVAAAQTVPVAGDVDANLKQHVRLARALAEEPPEVLVFPELSLTGYELELAEELAFSEEDQRLAPLLGVAASHSTTLIVGAPVKLGQELHIGAFIVAPQGSVEIYTKQRLGAFPPEVAEDGSVPPPEDSVFCRGERQPLVPMGAGSGAIGICAESLFASHPQAAADRGARTYLTGHFGIPLDVDWRLEVLGGHARRHAMAVAFANYAGPTGGLVGGGKSAIWSPTGECLAQLGPTGAGVVFACETRHGWRARALVL